jgi:DNA topoisomerase-6 subunit B
MGQKVEREPAFESISVAEFFYRNRQMAGFGNTTQALYSAIRELVENSLDSCEDAQVQPRVDIQIQSVDADVCRIEVSDNGNGVPADCVPDAFAKVLYGSKYHQRQRRGAFGLGATMAILYGQISTNTPVTIHTRDVKSEGTEFSLLVDVESNTPIVKSRRSLKRPEQGTTVGLTLKGDLNRARDRIVDYLCLTSVSSPYARVSLCIDGDRKEFGGWCESLPAVPQLTKPHPQSADLEILRRLSSKAENRRLKEWLVDSFQRVGEKTASRFLEFMNLDPRLQVSSMTREDLARLSTGLRKYDRLEGPDTKSLSPIGEESFLLGVRSVFNTSAAYYSKRAPCGWLGHAFVIEAVLASGDDFPRSELPTIFRFANRVPLLYDSSEDVLTKNLRKVNWKRYNPGLRAPLGLFANVSSTRIPFKAAGKQSIDSVPEIENEVAALYRDLGRQLKKGIKHHQKSGKQLKKMREFRRLFRLLVKHGASLADCETPATTAMIQRLFEVDSSE